MVMLTALTEMGKVKCHKYWPEDDELMEFPELEVRKVGDRPGKGEFELIHKETGRKRIIL